MKDLNNKSTQNLIKISNSNLISNSILIPIVKCITDSHSSTNSNFNSHIIKFEYNNKILIYIKNINNQFYYYIQIFNNDKLIYDTFNIFNSDEIKFEIES
jgi:hypothetical protein